MSLVDAAKKAREAEAVRSPPRFVSLPVVATEAIESPAQMFKCEFYRSTIAAGVCIARQRHRYKQRLGGSGPVKSEMRVSKALEYCASGDCGQGNTIAAALKDYKPEETDKHREHKARVLEGQAKVAEIEKKLEERKAAAPAKPKKSFAEFQAEKQARLAAAELTDQERREVREGKIMEQRKCEWKEEPCNTALGSQNKSGLCSRHNAVRYMREKNGHKPRKAKADRKPRTLGDVARKHAAPRPRKAKPNGHAKAPAAAPAGDVVELLEAKRDGLRDQADKIDQALELLRA